MNLRDEGVMDYVLLTGEPDGRVLRMGEDFYLVEDGMLIPLKSDMVIKNEI